MPAKRSRPTVTAETIRKLKQQHSAALLQMRGVCGAGVEQDENGSYVLAIHLAEDSAKVREAVVKRVGSVPVKFIRSGPFRAL
jgi:RNA 3'-terminal phosphate cyclase